MLLSFGLIWYFSRNSNTLCTWRLGIMEIPICLGGSISFTPPSGFRCGHVFLIWFPSLTNSITCHPNHNRPCPNCSSRAFSTHVPSATFAIPIGCSFLPNYVHCFLFSFNLFLFALMANVDKNNAVFVIAFSLWIWFRGRKVYGPKYATKSTLAGFLLF